MRRGSDIGLTPPVLGQPVEQRLINLLHGPVQPPTLTMSQISKHPQGSASQITTCGERIWRLPREFCITECSKRPSCNASTLLNRVELAMKLRKQPLSRAIWISRRKWVCHRKSVSYHMRDARGNCWCEKSSLKSPTLCSPPWRPFSSRYEILIFRHV